MTAQKMPPPTVVRVLERARHVLGRAHQRSVPPAGAMMEMILWAWRVQGISVAAELRVADALAIYGVTTLASLGNAMWPFLKHRDR